jgi:hypothetical protein
MEGESSKIGIDRIAEIQIENLIRKESRKRFEQLVLVISFFSWSIIIFSYQLFLWQIRSFMYYEWLPTTITVIFTLAIDMLLAGALTFVIWVVFWATRK